MDPAADISVAFAHAVIEAVRTVAADEIMPRYRSVVAERKDDGSLVTDADFAAQHALAKHLARIEAIPMLGEEMAREDQARIFAEAPRFWCVDPVDGTSNFANGIPYFAVSVALMQGGRPLFGTVYDPVSDEAFYAVRDAGAFLNRKPLVLSPSAPTLAAAHVEVSLRRDTKALRNALKRHPPCAKRRTSGSSTLSWCDLAAGRIDAMLHSGQKMWDYAAGALILAEAGGALCTIEADDFWSAGAWSRSVIAARTPELLGEWREWVRQHA
jgi:myo-inositol-1(or 4)-monophosphatase